MQKRVLFGFYALTLLLVMCSSNSLSFTWHIPRLFITIISIVVPLLYMGRTKCDTHPFNLLLCGLWAIVILFMVLSREAFSIASLLRKIGEILCVVSVVLLPIERKKDLLKFITKGLCIIVAISLGPWILHLLGVPLPHSKPFLLKDGFHWVTNYYFFLTGDEARVLKFPRFRGMFVEGGQVAPVCVFLYFANNKELPLWQKITLFTAIILSFSLAGYVTFTICYFLYNILKPNNKYKIIKISLFVSVIAGLFVIFNNPKNQNSAFHSLIIARLQYDDEKGLTGNNRSTEYLDYRFLQMMESDDKYIGYGRELSEAYKTDDNWTKDSSGIKKFILWNGLIGTSLVFLFMLTLLLNHRNYRSFVLWICVVVNFLIRDLLLSQMWIVITILGIFVLKYDYLMQKQENVLLKQ